VSRGTHEWCNRVVPGGTIVFGLTGGSNAAGNAAATGNPALLGYSKPSNCTLYLDGASQASYPTDKFGPEVGVFDELVNEFGISTPIVCVKHAVAGSSLSQWSLTYWPEMRTYLSNLSLRIVNLLMVNGGNDAENQSAANGYATEMLTFMGNVRRDHGAGIGISWPTLNTNPDDLTKVYTSTVKAAQLAFNGQGHRKIDIDDLDWVAGDSHYEGPEIVEIGRRYARYLVEDGVVTPP
jgi:hypothetical protein